MMRAATSMLLVLSVVVLLDISLCEAADPLSMPSFEKMLDASQQMASGTDYDRKFLNELKTCWSSLAPE